MNQGCIVILLACAAAASGCATRLYPVCWYESRMPVGYEQANAAPQVRDTFSSATGVPIDRVAVSSDLRWVIANVSPVGDSKARRLWPRLGCIGSATSSSPTRKQAHCVSYIEDFVTNRPYTEPGTYVGTSGTVYADESRDPDGLVYCSLSR